MELPDPVYEKLEEASEALGLTVSELLLDAIERGLREIGQVEVDQEVTEVGERKRRKALEYYERSVNRNVIAELLSLPPSAVDEIVETDSE